MVNRQHREIGKRGEEMVCTYLVKKGFIIRERNFRRPFGEIDIVAEDAKGRTVFVEVKARRSEAFGTMDELVDPRKLRKLSKVIRSYLSQYRAVDDWRLDLVCVMLDRDGELLYLEHVEDIEY
jgi:putative endonuclease